MIRVTQYFDTGREQSQHDCYTIEEAFKRLERSPNMRGFAEMLNDVPGIRGWALWTPGNPHTWESFRRSIANAWRPSCAFCGATEHSMEQAILRWIWNHDCTCCQTPELPPVCLRGHADTVTTSAGTPVCVDCGARW